MSLVSTYAWYDRVLFLVPRVASLSDVGIDALAGMGGSKITGVCAQDGSHRQLS
jgi:hypothetical protein